MIRDVKTGYEVTKRKGFTRMIMALIGVLVVILVDVQVVLPATLNAVTEANITGVAGTLISTLVPLGLGILPVILIFRMLD